MLDALFSDPVRIASEWYRWGVALGLAITLVTTCWVSLDSQRRGLAAPIWRILSLVAALIVAPGAVLSLTPNLATNLGGLTILLAYLGIFATVVALLALILYTAGIGVSEEQPSAPEEAAPTITRVSPTLRHRSEQALSATKGQAPAPQPAHPSEHPPSSPTSAPAIPTAPVGAMTAVVPLRPPSTAPVVESQTLDLSTPIDDRTRVLQPEAPKPLPLAWLVVMNGLRAGKEFRLEALTDIGRDSRYNQISLDDATMSRQHARVRLEKEGFVIYDLASANGVVVNGQKEQRRLLKNGDRITIGQTVLAMMMVQEAPETSPDQAVSSPQPLPKNPEVNEPLSTQNQSDDQGQQTGDQ